jgi:hypothetical protein
LGQGWVGRGAGPASSWRPRGRCRQPRTQANRVGLEERDDGFWSLYLDAVLLGTIDEAAMKVLG